MIPTVFDAKLASVVPLVATGLTVIAGLCSAKGTTTDDDEVVFSLTLGLEGIPM